MSQVAERGVDLQRQVTLLDLLDRMLESGVVVRGQLVLAIAEIDLVKLDLSVLLGAVETWENTAFLTGSFRSYLRS